jgi:hypothetical protein
MIAPKVRLFLATMGLLILGCLPSIAAEAGVLEATICSISSDPQSFDGKIVLLHGQLNSDGIENTNITNKSCESYGIAIVTPTHFKGEARYIRTLQTGHPGTLDKTITGTFVGRFIWQPRKIPKRVLELKEVRDISVVMK